MPTLPRPDAAKYLGVSVSTLRRWTAIGLPVVRQGRIVRYEEQDLRQWLDSHKVGNFEKPRVTPAGRSASGTQLGTDKSSSAQAKQTLGELRRGVRKSTPRPSGATTSRAGGSNA